MSIYNVLRGTIFKKPDSLEDNLQEGEGREVGLSLSNDCIGVAISSIRDAFSTFFVNFTSSLPAPLLIKKRTLPKTKINEFKSALQFQGWFYM